VQRCEGLEEPKQERNQKQESVLHVNIKEEKQRAEHILVSKGVKLDVKSPQIVPGHSNGSRTKSVYLFSL